ncbi:MAG TPA: hypothetical protein VGC56_17840 [Allosphingosinicella sp.]|jgi:hypothetical protein
MKLKIIAPILSFTVVLATLIREWNSASRGMLWLFGIALAVGGAVIAVSVRERLQQRARSSN